VIQAMHDELMAKETLRGEDLDRLIPNGKKMPKPVEENQDAPKDAPAPPTDDGTVGN